MSSLAGLLAELARRDIHLAADGEKLRVDAPKDALPPELRSALVERKAELLAHLRSTAAPAREGDAHPLSPGQRRLWSLAKLRSDAAYNVPTAFRLAGRLDVRALEQSLRDVQRRHEALRTTYAVVDGQPVQRVHEAAPLRLPVTDLADPLAGPDGHADDDALRRAVREEVRRPFDLERGPTWRAKLLRVGDDDHALVLTMHHIAFDGRSKPIVLKEIGDAYRSRAAGGTPAFPPLGARYVEFAAWQLDAAREAEANHLVYWQRKLAGDVEALELPADRPRPDAPARGARSATFALPGPLAQALRAWSRQEQSSLYITLLAAFLALLHGRTGQRDMLVVSPFASRDRTEFEGLVGYLNAIVPLRVDVDGTTAFRELVGRVRRAALEAFEHQNVPLDRLAELPGMKRVPLARALFSWQDTATRILDLDGIVATPIDVRKEASDFDLAFYAEGARDGGVGGVVEYDGDRFDDATIDRLLRDLERLLEAALADPHRPVAGLPKSVPDLRAVEARLGSHPQIDRAVVVRRAGHAGSIAYLVLNEHDVPRLDDLRAFLRGAFPDYLVPAALVTVDRMPLRADGTIDLAALPEPASSRNRSVTPYVAPRTPLERRLAEIWRRVLWLDADVSVEDRFADLGGHSLLSAQLVVEVERELGRPMPARALAGLSTVAAMARGFDGDTTAPRPAGRARQPSEIAPEIVDRIRSYTASWAGERPGADSLLVGLNTSGTKAPLFWCLQRHQELAQLARYLGPDQPVWGMRSGHNAMEKSDANIGALATLYGDEIFALAPESAFVVGGNCQAARIAFRIARKLARRGRQPALLILHEKFVREPYPGSVALMFGRGSESNPHQEFARPEAGWRKLYGGTVTYDAISGAHMEFFDEPNVQEFTDAIRLRMHDAVRAYGTAPVATPVQRLPADAYRANLAFEAPATLRAGATVRIDVSVTNRSAVAWRPFAESGIALVNRWADENRGMVAWLDGWTPLPSALAAGDAVVLALEAKAPVRAGRYILAVDLVDEGIATFVAMGSTPAQHPVTVEPAAADYNAAPLSGVPGD